MSVPLPTTISARAQQERFPALDGLRGLAILMVLFHHLFVFNPTSWGGERLAILAEFAGHGVDLFFALSGFLIARQLAAGRTSPGFARRFWWHRLAKILPLYLLLLAGVFLFLRPLLVMAGHPEKLGWLLAGQDQWPWYLFFVSNVQNALVGHFTNPALDVCWSLAVEVQFYVIAFVIARLVSPAHWPRVALVAIIGAIAFRAVAVLTGATWITILVLTPGRLDAFAAGILAASASRFLTRRPGYALWGVVALPLLTPWSRSLPAVEIVGYTVIALAAGVAIERGSRPDLADRLPIRWLKQPALIMLGRISYSVYLTHLPIRAAMRDILLPGARWLDSPSAWLMQFAYWLGCGGVCIIAGWLTWRLIEEPARQMILRISCREVVLPVIARES